MKKITLILFVLLLIPLATAATLKGSVYNSGLGLEENVLIEIDNQKLLSKDGSYTFELEPGSYTLTATKIDLVISETIKISKEGTFVYDIFLLDDLSDEDDLWQDTENDPFSENDLDVKTESKYEWWRYALAGAIIILLFGRFLIRRKKYGSLRIFRKRHKLERKKTIEEHKEELSKEPGYLERVLDIIKKHDGRIHQKVLRKEMLDISESKVSLILTELEHKGKIEKIKKGRGKVIILKE